MAREMNQADWRRDRNVKDQFGRLWLVAFETGPAGQGGSNMPTGQIMAAGWDDPLSLPQEYITVPNGEFGEPDRNRLHCDYARWYTQQAEAARDWKQRLWKVGQQQYKQAFNPQAAEDDDFLLSLAGPRVWPPPEAIARAARGDQAMLGLAPLTVADRKLLGKETLEDLGFAPAPTVTEQAPIPKAESGMRPMRYFSFVAKMKEAGVTDPEEIKAHWLIYRAEHTAA